MKAVLKNYRESPRKVRMVANLVKGKKVDIALAELNFLSKKASLPIKKLINSAVANAKVNNQIGPDNLYIKDLTVDKGRILKRGLPMSRGRSFVIRKKMSHVVVSLAEKISNIEGAVKDKKIKVKAKTAVKAKIATKKK